MKLKSDLIKNFAIGFLPIFVFIIADEFFGTTAGIIIAVISGIGYFLYYFIRYRRLDWFILFDTLLIVLMGGVSLLLHDDLFFKLKPALIELILLSLLGIHAFSDKPVLLNMTRRYMKNVEILPAQAEMMKTLSRALFFIFAIHIILIIYSAYFWGHEAWAFISGGLVYIIFGIVLLGQWIYIKWIKNKRLIHQLNPDEEWFDVVNEKNEVVGKAPRSRIHGNPALLHRVVHLHIFNNQGKLYLQKRAGTKDLYPGRWDTAVGGHVSAGESVTAALIREADEELGIKVKNPAPVFHYIMRNHWESEMVHAFRMNYQGPFRINRDEVEIGRFWTIDEINRSIGKELFTPNFEQEFAMMIKMNIIKTKPGKR
ncbi:MAG: NUDIX domain-containing protein [Calditrichaceae bacterium]|nr:NUDIX domain-containing protein [Calditrichaceae bacterium]MBN2709983.1 NUDIX domain-containing protein [Calditrichaceae bacterium]RQV97322.1 MAG: NUDIX domain-containing protein [Calditrichota bacterium]